MMQWSWIGACFVLVACAVAWGSRRVRRRARTCQETLALMKPQLPLEVARVHGFPSPALDGRHCGYAIHLTCEPTAETTTWKLHTELHDDWSGRLLLQCDQRPGRMREWYGAEIHLTGDSTFDRAVTVATTDDSLARRVLQPYFRERLRPLANAHLQIEVDRRGVFAELTTTHQSGHEQLVATLAVFTTLCGLIDVALAT
ncbi:MAG: hypothetical protein HY696_06085 [Deltaproteobacteria bacterium]|nr:hypothetical protein [Deltaproteobacteria bacterium]